MPSEVHQNIFKLSYRPFAFTSYKGFLKTKIGLELVYLIFFMIFEEKYFSCNTAFY